MEYVFTKEEIQKVKEIMEINPNFKAIEVQRVILKGYIYTKKLIEHIEDSIITK